MGVQHLSFRENFAIKVSAPTSPLKNELTIAVIQNPGRFAIEGSEGCCNIQTIFEAKDVLFFKLVLKVADANIDILLLSQHIVLELTI